MKRVSLVLGVLVVLIISCSKEYSQENGDGNNEYIIGADCRISKISFTDTSTNLSLGSITATINNADEATDITTFDSLSATVVTNSQPTYTHDTIWVNPDEYFVTDVFNSGRVARFHRLTDPFDPTSPQIDIDYTYNTDGNLVQKLYRSAFFGPLPFYQVDYNFVAGNFVSMLTTDLTTSEIVSDATLTYVNTIFPKSYLNIFPDEYMPEYAQYSQFFNFGKRSRNAVQEIKVRNYAGGVLTADSTKTVFGSYQISLDNYVLNVITSGDDQPFLPAPKGKLKFGYKCK